MDAFPLKRKLNRLAQTSVNQTTHYARYIWSGQRAHVKTIQLAVFRALTYSFVMFPFFVFFFFLIKKRKKLTTFQTKLALWNICLAIAPQRCAVTRHATMLILQAVPNSYISDTLLPSFFSFRLRLQVYTERLMSELPSFLLTCCQWMAKEKKKLPEMETFQHFFVKLRSVSPPPAFFFTVSSSTRGDWKASRPPLTVVNVTLCQGD